MNDFNLEFIKDRRNELGIPLQEMAETLGFKNASNYQKYESGEYSFKATHLPTLAKKLNCKVEKFFKQNFAKTANKEVG